MNEQRPRVAALPLIAPISLVPQPSPTEVAVGSGTFQGQKIVVLQVAGVNGVQIYTLDCEQAKTVAKALEEASGSILIVPAGFMPH